MLANTLLARPFVCSLRFVAHRCCTRASVCRRSECDAVRYRADTHNAMIIRTRVNVHVNNTVGGGGAARMVLRDN